MQPSECVVKVLRRIGLLWVGAFGIFALFLLLARRDLNWAETLVMGAVAGMVLTGLLWSRGSLVILGSGAFTAGVGSAHAFRTGSVTGGVVGLVVMLVFLGVASAAALSLLDRALREAVDLPAQARAAGPDRPLTLSELHAMREQVQAAIDAAEAGTRRADVEGLQRFLRHIDEEIRRLRSRSATWGQ